MTEHHPSRGMRRFFLLWSGQFASLIGSGLTNFALGIWVYQTTKSITEFGVLGALTLLRVLIAPLAGAIVDRHDRRTILIISDSVAGLSTLVIAVLFALNALSHWMIYLLVAIRSICDGFRLPAFNASTTLLVHEQQLGRANGLMQVSQAMAQILPPVIAGFMMEAVKLWGVILIDALTFVMAIATLFLTPIPRAASEGKGKTQRSIWGDIRYGWTYILTTPNLLGLLLLFGSLNLTLGMISVLINPLLLAITTTKILGIALAISASGMLIGGITLSVWGGPKRRMHGILACMLLSSVCIALAGLRPSVPLITAAIFGLFFGLAMISGCMRTIFQCRVAPEVQGRVFSTIQMILLASVPLGSLAAGPLASSIFEPLLAHDGPLAGSIGAIIGVGPGRGIGFMFISISLLMLLGTLWGYLRPSLRLIEDDLADARPQQTFT